MCSEAAGEQRERLIRLVRDQVPDALLAELLAHAERLVTLEAQRQRYIGRIRGQKEAP